ILAYLFLQVSLIGATSIRDEQQQGTLESLFLTPATKITNVIAKLVIQIIITSFNAVLLYFAILVFIGPMDFSNYLIVFPLFFFMLIQFVGLGLIYAALTLKFKETIVVASNLSIFLIMIFSSMFYTFSTIPDGPLKFISLILPTSYSIDAIRTSLLGYPLGFPELLPFNIEIIIIIVSSFALLFFGTYIYLRIERQARRLGTLLEY
ncbi:MAG: ABC transporter permease, partial [Candidatus Heimdallarchaeota archaeon]